MTCMPNAFRSSSSRTQAAHRQNSHTGIVAAARRAGVVASTPRLATVASRVGGESESLESRLLLAGAVGAGSSLAYYGESQRLIQPLNEQGNRVSDFSLAGYGFGAEPPDVSMMPFNRVISLTPEAGDDTARIQAALDQVGALELQSDGLRGVVQLSAGEFEVAGSLRINDSGVVLRGVGDGDDPATSTILRATGTDRRNLLEVGPSVGFISPNGARRRIVDKYVPVGATSFRVDNVADWVAGDAIVVRRPSPAEWISDIGMDRIPDNGSTVQWAPGDYDQDYERVITRIEGDRVFIDAPLMNAFEQRYGGGEVFKYRFDRIENVGVENIRGVSDFTSPTDEDHSRSFIVINAVRDGWVKNVTGQHFVYATVHATLRSRNITVDTAKSLDPVSEITGGRRYAFNIDGQFVLMKNLESERGRHDFVNNARQRNRGPNVFLNAAARFTNSSQGPHQRWSTGTLYDTVSTGGLTEAKNRGNSGTGHGWAGANMVFWNNSARRYEVENPPTAQNWLIGSTGRLDHNPATPPTLAEHGAPIDFQDAENPLSSLYVAQRLQRDALPDALDLEFVLGDYDLGENDGAGSDDDVFVDAAWQADVAAAAGGSALAGFDIDAADQFVPLTFDFTLGREEAVVAAVLSLGLRGTAGDSSDDRLFFESTGDARTLTSLGLAGPLSQSATSTLTIELTGDDLRALQDGTLNLAVGEDTNVDWANLQVVVDERPNSPPTIDDASFTLDENSPLGTVVGTVLASDPDLDPLAFNIRSGNTGGAFEIDDAGVIRVANPAALDFETQPQFTLVVEVRDDGLPRLSDSATVTVSLNDLNETPPTIADQTFSLPENSADATLVGTVVASDPDAGQAVTLSLVGGNDSGAFTLSSTGELRVADSSQLDFETTPTFTLTVRAEDDGTPVLGSSATVVVQLLDRNEVTPTVQDETFSLDENSAAGTVVGTVVATDTEAGQSLSLAIVGGNTGGAFAIDDAGKLRVANAAALDFETTPRFVLTVEATDDGQPPLSGQGTIVVDLVDLNERPPVVQDASFTLEENTPTGVVVGAVVASDPDAGQSLSYAITAGNDDNAFAISATGELVVANQDVLDFETRSTYSLTVAATDDGRPRLTGSGTVTVTLRDLPETRPTVNGGDFVLDENEAAGTVVGIVTATDPDPGQTLTYALSTGNEGGAFAIDDDGVISVADSAALDFETTPQFTLTVTATDDGLLPLAGTATVTVSLRDLNEAAPQIDDQTLLVKESVPTGTVVGQVVATDADTGQNLRYELVSGNEAGAFDLDETTGELRVRNGRRIDFERSAAFSLLVRVTDDGTPTRSGEATITVAVVDVDERRPLITVRPTAGGSIVRTQRFAGGGWDFRESRLDHTGEVTQFVVGDFDGDDRLDLALWTEDGTVLVRTSVGTIAQADAVWNTRLVAEGRLLVGDVNGDGLDDLIINDRATASLQVAVSDGSSFTSDVWQLLTTDRDWGNARVGDFNGDGQADVALQESRFGKWYFALSTATADGGRFVTQSWGDSFGASRAYAGIEVGDVDGDGRDELIALNAETGYWLVGFVFQERTFETWARWTTEARWENVLVGDFDGDGNDDVAAQTATPGEGRDGVWYVAPSVLDPDATPDENRGEFVGQKWSNRWNPAWDIREVRAADIDGDGRTDLLGQSGGGGVLVGLSTGLPLGSGPSGFQYAGNTAGLRPIGDSQSLLVGLAPMRPGLRTTARAAAVARTAAAPEAVEVADRGASSSVAEDAEVVRQLDLLAATALGSLFDE